MANKLDLPSSLEQQPFLQMSRLVYLKDLLNSGRSGVQNSAEAAFSV
jgi:hypothetical protein